MRPFNQYKEVSLFDLRHNSVWRWNILVAGDCPNDFNKITYTHLQAVLSLAYEPGTVWAYKSGPVDDEDDATAQFLSKLDIWYVDLSDYRAPTFNTAAALANQSVIDRCLFCCRHPNCLICKSCTAERAKNLADWLAGVDDLMLVNAARRSSVGVWARVVPVKPIKWYSSFEVPEGGRGRGRARKVTRFN